MEKEISKRDWETLSAYLDGQLPAKKLARFEARLSQDSNLQSALNELHENRYILQNAPRLRVPRNFFLTVEMVGKPRQLPRLAPAFGWVSAITGFLFVFILMGDFIRGGGSAVPDAIFGTALQPVAIHEEIVPKSSVPQSEDNAASMDVPSAGGVSEFSVLEEEQPEEFLMAPEGEIATEATPTIALEPTQTDLLMAAEVPEGEGAVEAETLTNTSRSLPSNEATEIKDESAPTATLPVQEGGQHIEKTATKEPFVMDPETVDQPTSLPPTLAPTVETAQFLDQTNLTPEAAMNKGAEVGSDEVAPDENLEAVISQDQAQSHMADSQENKLINGVKVLLLLLSVGTAIAWFYLQRRGG